MNPCENFLVVIAGPTAVGKTAAALAVAKYFQTVILSADSRQFYREMTIGTAKPTPAELAAVPHFFINSLSIFDQYTAGNFEKQGLEYLQELFKNQRIVLLSGGSGLFIKALCEGFDDMPEVPQTIKTEIAELYRREGIVPLQEEICRSDPDYAAVVDMQNPHRLIRAISVCRATGRPYSDFRSGAKKQRFFTPVYILLELERSVLYQRINQRVDAMMAAGLVEEAQQLYPYRYLNALQTVGYQELFEYFDGHCTLEEAITNIKTNTRRYAKRQMTWFRKDHHWTCFHPEDIAGICKFIKHQTLTSRHDSIFS